MLESDNGLGSSDLPVTRTGEAEARFGVDAFKAETIADRRTAVEFENVLARRSSVGRNGNVRLFEWILRLG